MALGKSRRAIGRSGCAANLPRAVAITTSQRQRKPIPVVRAFTVPYVLYMYSCACTCPHVRTYQVPVICSVAEEVQACPQFIGRHPPDTPSAATAAAAAAATSTAVAAGQGYLFFFHQPSSRFFTNFWCRAGHNEGNEKPAKLVPDERLAETRSRARARELSSGIRV
ncbi:hypothetical protein ALC53_10777 [Atta colombica]|uniref:Uncharacterized protein n=1 Tax=Atta colombica TaxID=520822 RepID=A0A195B2M5_9HYME|nr:hypothetical protein ALC53_10777 [Atta colombica]